MKVVNNIPDVAYAFHWVLLALIALFGELNIVLVYLAVSLIFEAISVVIKYNKNKRLKFSLKKFAGGYAIKLLFYAIIVSFGHMVDVFLLTKINSGAQARDYFCYAMIGLDFLNTLSNFRKAGYVKEVDIIEKIFFAILDSLKGKRNG